MTIATTIQKESVAIGYGNAITHASLHSADPGTTGTSEISGGAPAYARKAISWVAGPSDGAITGSVTFDVPASTATTHVGLWDALTAGNFRDKGTAAYSSQPTQGQLTVNLTYTQS